MLSFYSFSSYLLLYLLLFNIYTVFCYVFKVSFHKFGLWAIYVLLPSSICMTIYFSDVPFRYSILNNLIQCMSLFFSYLTYNTEAFNFDTKLIKERALVIFSTYYILSASCLFLSEGTPVISNPPI